MSTVRYFRWDDAGAPSLTGEVGSLTNLLRKCLVGTSGVAYGAKPSAGWSEAFVGAAANIAVFRNNPADGGSGCYAHINDNAPGAGGAREAQVTVFALMTDINTGTNATSSPWHRKSRGADAAAQKWLVVADGKTAWVHCYGFGSAMGSGDGFDTSLLGFGDYVCVDAGNAFRYFCMGRASVNSDFGGDINAFSTYSGAKSSAFTAQSLDGISGVVQPSISAPLYVSDGGIGGSNYPTPPHAISGETYFAAEPIIMSGTTLLGRMRGLHLPYHNIQAVGDGAEYPGYAGKVVAKTRVSTASNSSYHVGVVLDAVGPWL